MFEGTTCPSGFEALFTKTWQGLDQNCNCIQREVDRNNYKLNTPLDYSQFVTTGQTCQPGCKLVNETEVFVQHPIKGKVICGFTNSSFNYELIPKATNMPQWSCKASNLLTCPGKQDLDRQLCVDDFKKCPINGISIKF